MSSIKATAVDAHTWEQLGDLLALLGLSANDADSVLRRIETLSTVFPPQTDARAIDAEAALHASHIGVWEWDWMEGRSWWSAELYALMGIDPRTPISDETALQSVHPDDRAILTAIKHQTLVEQTDFDVRFRVLHPQRGLRWMTSRGMISSGNSSRMIGTTIDVTPAILGDWAVRESEERYRHLAENIPHMLWEADAQGERYYHNRMWYDYVGTIPGTSRGKEWLEYCHADDRECLIREWDQSVRTAAPYDAEARFCRHDGTYRWFRIKGAPVRSDDGRVVKWVGTCTDVNDRKCSEEALRESEQRFRMLADNITQLAWITDASGWIGWYNERWYEYTGTSIDDMVGWGWQKVHHPSHVVAVTTKFRQAIVAGDVWEDTFPLRGADGHYRWFLSRAVPIRDSAGRILHWFGTNTDITEIEERQRKLDAIMEHAPVGLALIAPNDRVDMMSRHGKEMFGHTTDDLRAKSIAERALQFVRVDGVTRPTIEELPSVRALGGEHFRDTEWILHCPHGEPVALLISGGPLRDQDGEITGAVIAWTDVSELKAAQHAVEALNRDLQRNVDELQTLIHASPIGIVVGHDSDCRHITFNPAAARLFGVEPGKNVSVSNNEAVPLRHRFMKNGRALEPEDLPMQYAARLNIEVRDYEFDAVCEDGTTLHLSAYASPLHDGQGRVRGCLGILIDVTQRRQLEQELIKTQKLESLGVLAGGIAHDFNNILTALFGNITLARLYVDDTPVDREKLQDTLMHAESAFKRARDLAQQLLTFARGGAPIRRITDVGGVLREAVDFALHGSRLQAVFAIAADLWPANIDEAQIGQAVHNIVLNAVQATPGGGRLTIAATNAKIECAVAGLAPGHYVQIRLSDTGTGIPPEHIAKVFDPYFTTKAHGSGLGLATAYSIVTRHGGHISAASQLDRGTTLTIHLPAAPPTTGSVAARCGAVAIRRRVLLMDDEAPVREVGAALLESLGYEVTVAANGEAAVAAYCAAQAQGCAFDAVILDLTVAGGMGGEACLTALRRIDPEVCALASSGYFNNPLMARHADFGFRGAIPKPYQLNELSAAIADAIKTRPEA